MRLATSARSRHRNIDRLDWRPALEHLVVHEPNRVKFDAEAETEILRRSTARMEPLAVKSGDLLRRGDASVEGEAQNEGSEVRSLLLIAVADDVRLLDGEVHPVVSGFVPPVDARQTERREHAQNGRLQRPDAVFVTDALVREHRERPDGIVELPAQHFIAAVQRDVAADVRDNLSGEPGVSQEQIRDAGTGSGVMVDVDSATDVVKEQAGGRFDLLLPIGQATGKAAVVVRDQFHAHVMNVDQMLQIVLGLALAELITSVCQSDDTRIKSQILHERSGALEIIGVVHIHESHARWCGSQEFFDFLVVFGHTVSTLVKREKPRLVAGFENQNVVQPEHETDARKGFT